MGAELHDCAIAIVGMECVFPGAPDLAAFRRNLEGGVDAIREAPASRWDPALYERGSDAPDRIYCRRGGFIDEHAFFDALGFGVMPVAARGAEPDQLLALQTAARALADAGYEERPFARDRAAVILGRGGYLSPGLARVDQHVRFAEQLAGSLRVLVPGITEEQLESVKREVRASAGPYGPDTAIGLVPNLAASRIANRLDLHGPAYTVDAACASALLAVDHAVSELRSGRADLVLAGGVHLCHDVTFWSVFCRLGALSRNEQIRPFDRRADGLLIGEGVGVVVLKRLQDAERDGDRVYAVIRGVGVSSDGRAASLMQPSADGQLLAIERAWRGAALDPQTIGLLEAHGTGTPVGDATELESLARFFGREGDAAIGSVKSMIGHTMPAAGAAGLIKAALAVHHAVLPPTLHCDEPHPSLAGTIFRPLRAAEPWEGPVRRAGVNAFGFGGINAHVVLEAVASSRVSPSRRAPLHRLELVAGASPAELLAALEAGSPGDPDGRCRLAIVDPTRERMATARKIVERGAAWRSGRHGIFFAPEGLADDGAKIAFLFPGVDASFEPRVDDVADWFALPRPDVAGRDLESIGHGIIEVSRLLFRALGELGVRADAMAGHSIGEWTGMVASGLIPKDAVEPFVASLVPGSLEVPGVAFAAAGCGLDQAEEAIDGLPEIAVSHDNCPHQLILCGRDESIDVAVGRLREAGVLCQKLPFRSGFHSPLFAPYLGMHREHLARLPLGPATTPLYSATTCTPYPDEPDAVRALAIDHLVRPVRFREVVEKLHDEGARIFVQVGTGSLVGFVDDTLRGRPHAVVSANVAKRSGLEQLVTLAAALWVEGVPVKLDRLPVEHRAPARRGLKLELGPPRVTLTTPVATAIPAPSTPVFAELGETLRAIETAAREVAAAYHKQPAPPAPGGGPREIHRKEKLSVAGFPELIDHCFYRQPEGWPDLSDRFPVVPMTATIAKIMDVARELAPGLVPIAVERVKAYRWIAVEPPVELDIKARFDGHDRVEVEIDGYAQASVVVAAGYPEPPSPSSVGLLNERPAPVTAEELYSDRWMFHGPAFHGVRELGPTGDDGIRGVLESLPTPGAMLDNAGQLFGYWVMLNTERDRLAMPMRIKRLAFYGPEPAPGVQLDCVVKVGLLAEELVRADLELAIAGKVWARIEAWEDRRFESDGPLFDVLRFPERKAFAQRRPEGFALAYEAWRSSAARDLIARRYLGRAEREVYEALPPRRQRGWLLGRIAIKDAVRQHLWARGHGPLFPVELRVENDAKGRPLVRGPFAGDLRVSVSHKEDLAVALVAVGRDVGIDLERVEPRGDDFERIALTDEERAMLPSTDRDRWVTRLWVAKEAVGKSRGEGLAGNPRRFRATDLSASRVLVDGVVVALADHGDAVIGWTL